MANADWADFAGMEECEIKMTCAAIIFACAADGDDAAEDVVDCFITNDDCLEMVCEDDSSSDSSEDEKVKGKTSFQFDTKIAIKKVFGF